MVMSLSLILLAICRFVMRDEGLVPSATVCDCNTDGSARVSASRNRPHRTS